MQRRSVVSLLALVLCAGTLVAAPAEQSAPQTQNPSMVSVDEHGQLRAPTLDEQKMLEAANAARLMAATPLKTTTTAAGAVSIALDERFDHLYVATTDAGGNVSISCIETPEAAYALLVAAQAKVDTVLRVQSGVKPAAEKE